MVTKIEGDLVQTTGVEGCQWLRGSCYGETVGIINGTIHNWAFTWEGGTKKVWLVESDGKGVSADDTSFCGQGREEQDGN